MEEYVKIDYPVIDTRTGKIHSKVECKERDAKFFAPVDRKEEEENADT